MYTTDGCDGELSRFLLYSYSFGYIPMISVFYRVPTRHWKYCEIGFEDLGKVL